MKIAFDVKGTLYGNNEKNIRRLYDAFARAGHTMFVWSNSYNYATATVDDLKLGASPRMKHGTFDRVTDFMDICVEDDRTQTWLASTKIVFVDEIKDDTDVKQLVETLINEHY